MESFRLLMDGFATALTLENLGYALLGVALGTLVGVLPGIGPAMTVALLLPITFNLEPVSAFIMFAGVYYGGMYGGSTTSILLKTPGESAAMITALEGNLMARRGRAPQALATAALGSFVAGTIATALLVVAAPAVVEMAISFGPEDYFALSVLAFTMISAVLSRSLVRGLAALGLGLAIGLVGIDQQTGQARLTFGVPHLLDGVDVVIAVVGLFAIGEALYVASRLRRDPPEVAAVGRAWMGRSDWARSWRPWLRGTALGFPIGALPGGGAEIPTFLSYATERRLAERHRGKRDDAPERGDAPERDDEFGKGAIEGVAGPEAANNASAAGTLVPMLTLGLPTSATAAVMLAALQGYGLQPGPQLFDHNPALVWGMIASLFLGNAMLLVLNLPLAPVWARLLRIPRPYLYAGIVLFAALGVYALNNSWVDLLVLYALGVLGYAMRRYGLPLAPAIIGIILGPLSEIQLRRALAISAGDATVLVTSPIAVVLLLLSAAVLLLPLARRLTGRRNA